ncbi:MAG: lysine--tRNA ligase [Halobacteriaceae archaeon]
MADAEHRAFWADAVADEVEARDPDDPIVVKGAVSPSGIPHVGHVNEILRGYYVAEVLRERGHEVEQLFVADDRDALRAVPRQLCDADWNLVELGDVDAGALGRNLGVPYTDVPDPFGDCHDSYGAHFTALLRESAAMLDVPLEVTSTTALYESGAFDEAVRETLADLGRARKVLGEFQDSVDAEYVPFMANCASCGRQLSTTVTGVDLDREVVAYECTGGEAGDREVEGCGHAGEATFREGKLPWRFEWPAGWRALDVDFEPFGKDHAEGSWPSGQAIAREVYGTEPPVPLVYEWFTLDGEALSSSSGNVVTVPALLDVVSPATLRYFFALNPRKQRDLSVERVDRLADGFDRFEALFMDEEADPAIGPLAERAYPFVLPPGELPEGAVAAGREAGTLPADAPAAGDADGARPGDDPLHPTELGGYDAYRRFLAETFADRVRLPYTFAAVLGMTDDESLRRSLARRAGHLHDDTPEWAVAGALARVPLARTWAERTDNEYNYRLAAERPAVDLDDDTAAALADVADVVAAGADGDAIQGEFYEAAERHGVDAGDCFAAGYELFFGQPSGPRLGPFLAGLDPGFVEERLRQ